MCTCSMVASQDVQCQTRHATTFLLLSQFPFSINNATHPVPFRTHYVPMWHSLAAFVIRSETLLYVCMFLQTFLFAYSSLLRLVPSLISKAWKCCQMFSFAHFSLLLRANTQDNYHDTASITMELQKCLLYTDLWPMTCAPIISIQMHLRHCEWTKNLRITHQ